MKRLAIYVAAEEVAAAYRELREHPSLHAEQRLDDCINLLNLRLSIFERRERVRAHEVRKSQVIEPLLHQLPTAEEEARGPRPLPTVEEEARGPRPLPTAEEEAV